MSSHSFSEVRRRCPMSAPRLALFLFAFASVVAGSIAAVAVEGSASETPSALIVAANAARARENAIHSGRFRIRATGIRTSLAPLNHPAGKPADPLLPGDDEDGDTADQAIVVEQTFVFDGHRWRFATEGKASSCDTERLRDATTLEVWDGAIRKSLVMVGPRSKVGSIRESPPFVGSLAELLPITIAYRPWAWRNARFDSPNTTIVDKDAIFEQDRCLVIRETRGDTRREFIDEYWLSRDKDYQVVRYLRRLGDTTSFEVNVKHQPNAQYGWVPSEWQYTFANGFRTCHNAWRAVVVDYALNGPVDDAWFDIEFPVGSLLFDAINDRQYLVRDKDDR